MNIKATKLTRDRPDRFYKPVRSNSSILYWLKWVANIKYIQLLSVTSTFVGKATA